MNLFYTEPIQITGNSIKLAGQEAQHAAKVLRLGIGDSIHITDGAGSLYHCRITNASSNELLAEIYESDFIEPEKPELILCIGMIKKRDRLEFAIEKAVELGAGKIAVYKADHSEKTGIRTSRFEQITLRAMKQSLRCHLPEVEAFDSMDKVIKEYQEAEIIVADETVEQKNSLNFGVESPRVLLIVGPEGGFSERERNLIDQKGCKAVSLGKYRLRTETAAITLLNHFQSIHRMSRPR